MVEETEDMFEAPSVVRIVEVDHLVAIYFVA
jgi:hypothetical protein